MTNLRTPKGTIDYNQKSSLILEQIIDKSTLIFKKHGASPIRTPVFELKEILLNKYGDDSKLIFDLKDQGGDLCSLRYDLTVPFARYLAQNGIQKIKRYQCGEVFRRDQPSITKGRFREFLQCDFDIAGSYKDMVADAEVIKIVDECLDSFNIGKYFVKINHRQILGAILTLSGLESDIHATICSTIDKIDKMRIEDIRLELKNKGCSAEGIGIIERYIKINGEIEEITNLTKDPIYDISCGKKGIDDLILLHEYLKCFNADINVKYDLSLARGTDYYTGIIFEASYDSHSVGAVIGGGRYDNLVDGFARDKGRKGMQVPCVGFSVGVMRIYTLLSSQQNIEVFNIVAFVGSSGGCYLKERLCITNLLWEHNIPAETYYNESMHFKKQATFCQKNGIRFLIILGEDEINKNVVQICDNTAGTRNTVAHDDVVSFIKKTIQ